MNINELRDVDAAITPFSGDSLVYNGTKWAPSAVTGGSTGANHETYIVELSRWGINNNGTNPIATTLGINNAFIWANQNNFGIVVLPKGTYLINKDSSVKPLSNTHYKFYGCHFVKETNGYEKYQTILLDGIKNVTIEGADVKGDRDTHDYTTTVGTHEWGYGIALINSCYNILIKNCDSHHFSGDAYTIEMDFSALGGAQHHVIWTTGTTYALNAVVNNIATSKSYKCTVKGSGASTIQPSHSTGIVASADGYSWEYVGGLVSTHFAKGDIDPTTGALDATKTNYTTVTKFFDTTGELVQSVGYFYYSGDGYGGYGTGINLNKVPIKVHFYGASNNYLGSKTTRSYEFIVLSNMPVGTTKVRFSYLQNYDLLNGNLHFVMCTKMPQYVTFQGCRGYKCRRQGSSVMGGRFITYDFCEFFDIGWATATSPAGTPGFGIDIEDGFMTNQKIIVTNSNFYDNKAGAFTCVSTRGLHLENNKFSGYVRLGGSGDDYFSLNNIYYGTITGASVTSGVEADGTFMTFKNDHVFGASVVLSSAGNVTLDNCVFSKCSLNTTGETVKIFNCKLTFDNPAGAQAIIFGSKNLVMRDTLIDIRRSGEVFGSNICDRAFLSNVKVITGESSGGLLLTVKNLIVQDCEFIHSGTSVANYSSIVATDSMIVENSLFKNLSFRFDGGGFFGGLDKPVSDSGYTSHVFKNNKIVWDASSAVPASHENRGQGVGLFYMTRLDVINNSVNVLGQGTSLGSLFNLRVYAEKYLNLVNNTISTTKNTGISTTGTITVDYAYRLNSVANPRPKTLLVSQNNNNDANSNITFTANLNSQLEKNIMGSQFNPPVVLSSLPAMGKYQLGEIIYNTNPIAGTGYIGWVNTVAGYADTATWTASTVYASKSRILEGGKIYESQNSGKSTATKPTFPTAADSTVDDKVGATTWIASTAYTLGNLVLPSNPNGYYYECTTAGTSGTGEPTWSATTGNTVNGNGTVVWTTRQIITWKQVGIPAVFKGFGLIQA